MKYHTAIKILIGSAAFGFLVFAFNFTELHETEIATTVQPNPLILKSESLANLAEEIPEKELPTIELIMVGDMLMHENVVASGYQPDGSYNFDHLFANVKDKVEAVDLAIVNQETILGGEEFGYTGYPSFNSPTALGDAEVAAGFDLILHATNHTLDKGKTGVLNCMEFWDTNYPDIPYLGINKSQEVQDNNIYVYEKEGLRIAILNYTYGTNGLMPPADMPFIVNYLDEEKVIRDIALAEELADFTIVCPHWGTEYLLSTDSYQERWTQIFLENGVDLVIGAHPHVIEPVEWVSDEEGNRMLVFYSLGNFINGTSSTGEGVMNRMIGGMADVVIGYDENGEPAILDYDAIPLVCHLDRGGGFTTYFLSDYTEDLANENLVGVKDLDFSLQACQELVEEVWGIQ